MLLCHAWKRGTGTQHTSLLCPAVVCNSADGDSYCVDASEGLLTDKIEFLASQSAVETLCNDSCADSILEQYGTKYAAKAECKYLHAVCCLILFNKKLFETETSHEEEQ